METMSGEWARLLCLGNIVYGLVFKDCLLSTLLPLQCLA